MGHRPTHLPQPMIIWGREEDPLALIPPTRVHNHLGRKDPTHSHLPEPMIIWDEKKTP